MSLLRTINPNLRRSQPVVSHNLHQLQGRLDETVIEQDQSNESEKSEDGITFQDEEEKIETRVGAIALQLTRHSTRYSVNDGLENPFTSEESDSPIKHSPNSNVRSWKKMLLAIRSRDLDRYPNRTAGVSFKSLSVYGFGSPTDYQKDVLNCLLEVGTMVRRLIKTKMQKIQILREFDGLIKSGEMLIVLGKPGSGCSTLLKTLSGEMSGISMSEDSVMNYQGMSIL